jgi:ribosomal protein L37AE/L43A
MSTKLRNIDAIKKMLDGQHKSQSKKSIGYQKTVEKTTREVGETWVDVHGAEWVQKEGFKIKKGKLDEIRALIEARKMPVKCPKCNAPMVKRLDKKFWVLEKHCFDCQVAFEHNLRIEGKYEAYEKERILKNAESWLKDAEQEAMEIVAAMRNPVTYSDVEGNIETWSGGRSPDEIADKIAADFKKFKEDFINKLKQELANDKA